jgi:membrane protein DedA with SNARE-associated domain
VGPRLFGKYGPRSIVLARCTPIVRTFTPSVSGMSRTSHRTFVVHNVIGGVAWGSGVTLLRGARLRAGAHLRLVRPSSG